MRDVHGDFVCAHCWHRWNEGESPCEHFQPGHGKYTTLHVGGHYLLSDDGRTWLPAYNVLTLVEA